MRFVAEYLEHVAQFELMAAQTNDANFKKQLLKQAEEYRKLAEKRVAEIGLPKQPQSGTEE
jgi:hypothetical protein